MISTRARRHERISAEIHFLKTLWGNGGKALILAALGAAAAMIIVSVAIVRRHYSTPGEFAPLEYISPQTIDNPGLMVTQGGSLLVTAVKCNHSSEDVGVDGRSYWRNLDTGDLVPKSAVSGAVRPPGCPTLHYANLVPIDLPPGRYQLEGVEVADSDDGRVQREAWHTETFVVEGTP